MTKEPAWISTSGDDLLQGDYLPRCLVSQFDPDHTIEVVPDSEVGKILGDALGTPAHGQLQITPTFEVDLIILSQSCDLEQGKAQWVALCGIYTQTEFEAVNPEFKKKGKWDEVRKGRIHGLHLVPALPEPQSTSNFLVIDFGEIFSLPYTYVRRHAAKMEYRWRMPSPYREYLSHAFGNYFTRVALP